MNPVATTTNPVVTTTEVVTTTTTTFAPKLRGAQYQTRAAQAAAVKSVILAQGMTEPGQPPRLVTVNGQAAFAEAIMHPAGGIVRFYLADGSGVKRRELLILPTHEKGYDLWLEVDGKLFPHQGKYVMPAMRLLDTIIQDA